MLTSQNGWPVLESTSPKLHAWVLPAHNGQVSVRLRNGSAGFLLAHNALRFAEYVEGLAQPVLDDWGYAVRPVRGQTTGYSNHAAGCAIDLNATRHPLGKADTFTAEQVKAIRHTLTKYAGCVRWGGNYTGRKDEMHFEVVATLAECEKTARALLDSSRGKRLLDANPGQREVILS